MTRTQARNAAESPTGSPNEIDDGARPPPLTITVGFAGHRQVVAPAQARRTLEETLAGIGGVQIAIARHPIGDGAETLGDAYAETRHLRLLTGDAPGADRLAIAAWNACGLGEVHALYPFRDSDTGAPITDDPKRAGPEERATQWRTLAAWTAFDGGGLGLPGDQAHAEVGRWIAAHSDVLLAFWDGLDARGGGGTGDVVLRALERGVPVVWLKPGRDEARLIEPNIWRRHADLVEMLRAPDDYAAPLEPDRLAAFLVLQLSPPSAVAEKLHAHRRWLSRAQPHGSTDPETMARQDYAARDPLRDRRGLSAFLGGVLDRFAWSAFDRFKAALGDLRSFSPPQIEKTPRPDGLHEQLGYRRLEAAFAQADGRANRLGAVHRSEQLLLIALAALAVIVSAAPSLAPDAHAHQAHVAAAIMEFGLGLLAFVVRWQALGAHRHRRWSDARRFAERLRAMLLTWPLGADVSSLHQSAPHTWTEWRAQAEFRAAGPPTGWIDGAGFRARAHWTAFDIIGGQMRYHEKERHLARHIDERVKRIEGASFAILMATLGLFLLGTWLLPHFGYALSPWVAGLVLVISAATPAVGGASLALEMTMGFGEVERRSTQCATAFAALLDEFTALERDHRLTLHSAQRLNLAAAELLIQDADSWREQLGTRRLRQVA
jgi:hypothetical protein